ncbi:MAG: hypothetical protein NW208_07855 [Bryobacter sp.]|nr:hypothetical protein [Bryobacter sp.]
MAQAQTTARVAWSSILRGGGFDVAVRTLVEPGGDVWVGGHSFGKYEAYGPNEPFSTQNKGASDIFLVKFRPFPDGTAQVLFFTWLGGGGVEELADMKFDNLGRIVLTGITFSNDWPVAGNAAQTVFGGDVDSFIAVVDPNEGGAASLFYSTYYGGAGREFARALAVSASGRIAMAGNTASEDLPFVTQGAQPNRRGGTDIFLLTINDSAAGGFSYASYLGGDGTDTATSILWDAEETLWFTGNTGSTDFPVTDNAYRRESSGFFDAYLAHLDPKVQGLAGYLYATYLGGQGNDEGRGLVQLPDGSFVLTGLTFSNDYPLFGAPLQSELSGACDLFLTRIEPRLPPESQILFSSYLGGTGTDIPYSLALVEGGRLAIGGYSMSGQLPVTADAIQSAPVSGFAEGMFALVDLQGENTFSLSYLTYLGGFFTDVVNSVAVDPLNPAVLYLAGTSTSADFKTTDGSIRPNPNPAPSAFITRIER